MSLFEIFKRKNINYSEIHGTEEQKDDMVGLVAILQQMMGELGDILGGRRKMKDNPHHPIPDLTNGIVTNIDAIQKLRKEIKHKKNS